jgi:hypothetical protein
VRRRIKRWSVTPRSKRRVESWHLLLAGLVGAALLAGVFWAVNPADEVEQLVSDVGPAEPPCPYLLRVADREQRCDPAVVSINNPQVAVDLLMPAMPKTCRPIVSDTKGRLYPLAFDARGSGFRGRIGPLPEQMTPFTLRFIAWDERHDKAQACGPWADYTVQVLRAPPAKDAGAGDAQP